MKIEGQGPNSLASTTEAQATQANDRVQLGRSDQTRAAGDPKNDRVNVSADARLFASAVREVARAPEVRQDVVERARQKLAAGEVGQDPLKLVDKIIDSLLSR
jgi:flagellar biosynthesis anti-sigma factor FlgM